MTVLMKRVGALLLLASISIAAAQAQGQRRMSPEEQKEAFDANFAELTTALALSEEDAPVVKDILWTQQEKRNELLASMRGSGGGQFARQGMREKMNELQADTNAQLADVLSEEQMEKFQAFQAERRQGQGRRGGQGQRRSQPQ